MKRSWGVRKYVYKNLSLEELLKEFRDLKSMEVNDIFLEAARNDDLRTMRMLYDKYEKDISNVDSIIREAAINGNTKIFTFLLGTGLAKPLLLAEGFMVGIEEEVPATVFYFAENYLLPEKLLDVGIDKARKVREGSVIHTYLQKYRDLLYGNGRGYRY